MRAPRFWYQKQSRLAKMLSGLGAIYAFFGRQRLKNAHPYQAKMPVLCVGNLSVGGVGKTPVCLALGRLMQKKNHPYYYLNHGYKAHQQSVIVDRMTHTALDVGDEALLLANQAPTVVDCARARGAQLAEKLGAQLLIMDDGFQNPSLVKTFSLVVVDGTLGFGNGFVMPAGPLREPVLSGLKRADMIVLVGQDTWGVAEFLHQNHVDLPIMTGKFIPDSQSLTQLKSKNVGAFAGIGHPEKFFQMLRGVGISLKQTVSFPDHYFYTRFDIENLKKTYPNLIWATTEKDWVKLPVEVCNRLVKVTGQFQFDDEEAVWTCIRESLK